jgi:hypothetical protein
MTTPKMPARAWIHIAVILGLSFVALFSAWRLWNNVSHAAAVFPLAVGTGVIAFYSAALWLSRN